MKTQVLIALFSSAQAQVDDMIIPGSAPAVEDALAQRVFDSQTGIYSYPWTQNLDNDYLSNIAAIHNNNDLIINHEVQNVFAGLVQPAVDVSLETLKSALDYTTMKDGSPYTGPVDALP